MKIFLFNFSNIFTLRAKKFKNKANFCKALRIYTTVN